jgi:hypothetical protein
VQKASILPNECPEIRQFWGLKHDLIAFNTNILASINNFVNGKSSLPRLFKKGMGKSNS